MTRLLMFGLGSVAVLSLGACSGGKDTTTDDTTETDTGDTTDTTDPAPTGDASNGETLYGSGCAACHLADGSGGIDIGGTTSPDLAVVVPPLDDGTLGDVIASGKGSMPGIYQSESDVADVIAYLRATFP